MTVDLLMSRMGTLVSVADSADSDVYGNVTETETETSVRYELQQQARDEVPDPGAWQVGAYRLFLPAATSVAGVDRFIAFELGDMFVPYGRIYSLDAYRGLMGIPSCIGAKHSSLSRQAEWARLALRNEVRSDFSVFTGNDLAIDEGVGMCGKGGQSVPAGVGQPSLLIDGLTVGGTA